ncbi:hypothetical protein MHB63_20730, partial [Bacillus sp. FSL H8-0547]
RLLVLLSEQNHRKSQTRTFPVISYLTARPEQSAPLFVVSSSISQLLCQNKIAQKGKPGLCGRFLICLSELNG